MMQDEWKHKENTMEQVLKESTMEQVLKFDMIGSELFSHPITLPRRLLKANIVGPLLDSGKLPYTGF